MLGNSRRPDKSDVFQSQSISRPKGDNTGQRQDQVVEVCQKNSITNLQISKMIFPSGLAGLVGERRSMSTYCYQVARNCVSRGHCIPVVVAALMSSDRLRRKQ